MLSTGEGDEAMPNDAVFAMIGREAPLDFFRRSGVPIRGEWRVGTWVSFALVMLACVFVYHWKTGAGIPIYEWFKGAELFPFNLMSAEDKSGLFGTVWTSMTQPGFYYSLAYCACVVGFGIRRINRRQTPYVTVQTVTLMVIQCVPLFLLPYIFLPWLGHNGWFSDGAFLKPVADALFPATEWDAHGREVLAEFGFYSGVAAVFLECVYEPAAGVVVGYQSGADFCGDSSDYLALGQGGLLRVDLFVRGTGRDDGGYAPAEDAARSCLESNEYGGAGDSGSGFCASGVAYCGLVIAL